MPSSLPDSRFWVPRIAIFQCQLVRGLAKFRLSKADLGVKTDELGFFLSESLLNVPIFPTFEKNKWDIIVSIEGRIWHREGYIARNHK